LHCVAYQGVGPVPNAFFEHAMVVTPFFKTL